MIIPRDNKEIKFHSYDAERRPLDPTSMNFTVVGWSRLKLLVVR